MIIHIRMIYIQIEEVDVVVGGHSHTFLYTGTPPSVEEPEGPYPTYVTQASGKVVPVVQVYCYTKYLGHLKYAFHAFKCKYSSLEILFKICTSLIPRLSFDAEGELLTPVDGTGVSLADVILLDSSIPKDPMIDEEMNYWREQLTEYTTPLGETVVFLEKRGWEESNIGDVLTDSMKVAFDDTEKPAQMAFINNGGIR